MCCMSHRYYNPKIRRPPVRRTVSHTNRRDEGPEYLGTVYLDDTTITLGLVIVKNARVLSLELITTLLEQSHIPIRSVGIVAAQISL